MKVMASFFVVLLVALIPAASEDEHESPGDGADHHEAGHHSYRHEIGFSIGGTDEKGHDVEFTWGVEYVYALSSQFGVGGILEYAGGELRNTILVAPVFWKPVGGWILLAGPGVEHHDGRGSEEHHLFKSGGEEGGDKTYFLLRVGTAYSFHVGERYALVPSINLDLVEGEQVWVGGVTFGVMF